MPTAPTPITALPTPVPQTSDPANFDTRADAFLPALPNFGDQANALAVVTYNNALDAVTEATAASGSALAAAASATAALAVTSYVSLVTDSLSLSTGAKSLTTGIAGKGFANTNCGTLIRLGDPTARMSGVFSSVSGSTATLTIDKVTGAGGPFIDWLLILSALESVPPDLAKAQAIAFAVAL